jgi:hypothetical protein
MGTRAGSDQNSSPWRTGIAERGELPVDWGLGAALFAQSARAIGMDLYASIERRGR